MVLLDQVKYELSQFEEPLLNMEEALNRDVKNKRIAEIEGKMNEPGFWEDGKASGELMKEMKNLKADLENYDTLKGSYDDLQTLIEMAEEENDDDLGNECLEEFEKFKRSYEDYRISTLLSGEFDHLDAKMFSDHLSPLRKQLIKSKLKALTQGRYRCSYRTKPVRK